MQFCLGWIRNYFGMHRWMSQKDNRRLIKPKPVSFWLWSVKTQMLEAVETKKINTTIALRLTDNGRAPRQKEKVIIFHVLFNFICVWIFSKMFSVLGIAKWKIITIYFLWWRILFGLCVFKYLIVRISLCLWHTKDNIFCVFQWSKYLHKDLEIKSLLLLFFCREDCL